MANSFLPGNYAQSTVALAIGAGDASFVLGSSAAFVVPSSSPQQQQGILRIDDTGNPNWNQITGPFEVAYFTTNTVGTNTISGLVRGQEGTSAKAFLAGATVSQIISQGLIAQLLRLDVQASQLTVGPIQVPRSAGGAAPGSQYGSFPVKIYQSVLGSSLASVNFGASVAIPGVYSHLLLEIMARGDTAAGNVECGLQFNADTTAGHYNWGRLTASATTVVAQQDATTDTSIAHWFINAANGTAAMPGVARIWIPNYAGTTFAKVARIDGGFYNSTAAFPQAGVVSIDQVLGYWNSTAAITQLTVFPLSGNFIAGSVFTLYGIP